MNARVSATGASRALREHSFARVARSAHFLETTKLRRLLAAGRSCRSYVTETPQDQDTATVPSSNLSSGSAKPERDPVPHKRNSADGGGHRWSEEDSSPHRTQEQDLSRAVRPMPTLNPNNIRPRDYVDLSNRVFVYLLRQATERHPRTSAIYYSRAEGALPSHADHKPFPAGTRGFFYWTANPRLTPLGGEIRFRITNNRFPNSMALGWDLLGPDGYSPWRMSVLQMLNTPLVDYLIDEQLISRFDIERFHNTRRGRAAKPRSNSQVCVQPGHPFVFDFTNLSPGYWETIWIVGHHFINWISFGRIAREPSAPRSGAAMFTVERTRYTSGNGEVEAYVVRCERILKPLEYPSEDMQATGTLSIVEGELVSLNGEPVKWSVRKVLGPETSTDDPDEAEESPQ